MSDARSQTLLSLWQPGHRNPNPRGDDGFGDVIDVVGRYFVPVEADKRKRRVVYDAAFVFRQRFSQQLSHRRLMCEELRGSLGSELRQSEKYFQPNEATRPLNGLLISIFGTWLGIGQVGRTDREDFLREARTAEEHPRPHWNGKRLMGVPGDGIGQLDSRDVLPKSVGKQRQAAPGSIGVKP